MKNQKFPEELKKLRILDFLLFFLAIFSAVFLWNKFNQKNQDNIIVNANGTIYKYSLLKDGIFTVSGQIGITTFKIKNKKVQILDSPCKEKTCINQKFSMPIVCLPNKIIIDYEKYQKKAEFDAISE